MKYTGNMFSMHARSFRSMRLILLLICLLAAPGSAFSQSTLQFPATGSWNGYLNQFNVVECSSYALGPTSMRLTVYAADGSAIGQRVFTIPSLGVAHVILNEFSIADSYGTFVLDLLSYSAADRVACVSSIYRFASAGPVAVDYAYALRVDNPLQGNKIGIFNSFDPDGGAAPALNWLAIVNHEASAFNVDIDAYDSAGNLLRTIPLAVAPRGRADVGLGHIEQNINGGQVYGMYVVRPQNPSHKYHAYLARYLQGSGGSYRSAYTLIPETGGCDSKPLFLSTMDPATNYVELANGSATASTVTVSIYNQASQLAGQQVVQLNPRSQLHINVNQYIGDSAIGYAKFTCSGGTKLAVNSMYYGHHGSISGPVKWAYGSQLADVAADPGERVVAFVNTFHGMNNWFKVAGTNPAENIGYLDILKSNGERVDRSPYVVSNNRIYDFALHQSFPADKIAQGVFETPDSGGGAFGELLRVFPHSNPSIPIGTIMRVPTGIVLADDVDASLAEITNSVVQPVAIANAGDGSNRLFIVEKQGRVRIHDGEKLLDSPFLDITSKVSSNGERGLGSIAFHPDYATNGRLFVSYTNLDGDSVVVEYSVSLNPNRVNAHSEKLIIKVPQPGSYHNVGQLQFGPDGYLYIASGDGSAPGDPFMNGQDLSTVLGAILRIDVDSGSPYAIPQDNPFVGVQGARGEIWAYGFRNPWRIAFDSLTGTLMCADVGQDYREEVDVIERGGNYGWNTMEGTQCFSPASGCDTTGLELPVFEYDHGNAAAVIGGVVYRGDEFPALNGAYVFGDFAQGMVWALRESQSGTWIRQKLTSGNYLITSFGFDENGEIYVTDVLGKVLKLES
ncbi:MAG: PQQ-dependent sugar dehydrogenase [Bdellovibrionales bacterium]|nr:PQQ-dependent sugar dehydrogenase [Bdellovibrionales bacterium]